MAKIVGTLTGLYWSALEIYGDIPVASILGHKGEHYFGLGLLALWLVLSFLAPGTPIPFPTATVDVGKPTSPPPAPSGKPPPAAAACALLGALALWVVR